MISVSNGRNFEIGAVYGIEVSIITTVVLAATTALFLTKRKHLTRTTTAA